MGTEAEKKNKTADCNSAKTIQPFLPDTKTCQKLLTKRHYVNYFTAYFISKGGLIRKKNIYIYTHLKQCKCLCSKKQSVHMLTEYVQLHTNTKKARFWSLWENIRLQEAHENLKTYNLPFFFLRICLLKLLKCQVNGETNDWFQQVWTWVPVEKNVNWITLRSH